MRNAIECNPGNVFNASSLCFLFIFLFIFLILIFLILFHFILIKFQFLKTLIYKYIYIHILSLFLVCFFCHRLPHRLHAAPWHATKHFFSFFFLSILNRARDIHRNEYVVFYYKYKKEIGVVNVTL